MSQSQTLEEFWARPKTNLGTVAKYPRLAKLVDDSHRENFSNLPPKAISQQSHLGVETSGVGLEAGLKCPCIVFGECGGCSYQDISYDEELRIKEGQLKDLLCTSLDIPEQSFESIEPSPEIYHYRHRLDLRLQRTKNSGILMGFSGKNSPWGFVPVDTCPIAREEISQWIPELKRRAIEQLPDKYRQANLVVRCGDDGSVHWGGIGQRSLRQDEKDYMWTEISGRKIFYALETFFQANLSILPRVFSYLRALNIWGPTVHFYDLYGGVGLFGIGLSDAVGQVSLIEDCNASVKLAQYNVRYHTLKKFHIIHGRVEEHLPQLFHETQAQSCVAMIDPPRAGLSLRVSALLAETRTLNYLIYLSCSPQSLARDLTGLVEGNWQIERIKPFDFFPRTKHLETLVVLRQKTENR